MFKTDSRGRVRVPRERREALLAEFARSGMSGAKFAAAIGVKYPTFASWVQERRRRAGGTAGDGQPALRWVEAVLETPAAEAAAVRSLQVELPGGGRMLVGDSRQVALAAELLRALGASTERRGC